VSYWTNAQTTAQRVERIYLIVIPKYISLLEDIGNYSLNDIESNSDLREKITQASDWRREIIKILGREPELPTSQAKNGAGILNYVGARV
jgi:hypothetical protein